MQNRSHRYDINRPRPRHVINILNVKCVTVRWRLHVSRNT